MGLRATKFLLIPHTFCGISLVGGGEGVKFFLRHGGSLIFCLHFEIFSSRVPPEIATKLWHQFPSSIFHFFKMAGYQLSRLNYLQFFFFFKRLSTVFRVEHVNTECSTLHPKLGGCSSRKLLFAFYAWKKGASCKFEQNGGKMRLPTRKVNSV